MLLSSVYGYNVINTPIQYSVHYKMPYKTFGIGSCSIAMDRYYMLYKVTLY